MLSPDNIDHYIILGDLDVAVSFQKDHITLTTGNICGEYTIRTVFNSSASNIVSGSIDNTLTNLVATDVNNLKFYSN